MGVYDITVPLHNGTVVWPGDSEVSVERVRSMDDGEVNNLSRICMSLHAGTHVDAPVHFVAGGNGVEEIPLEVLIGKTWVASLETAGPIEAEELTRAGIPDRAERVLLRTHNSALWAEDVTAFREEFAHLTDDGANWLVRRGIRLVGIDYLSVQGFHECESNTHRILLAAGVVIVESLNLTGVKEGWYDMYCLPLKVVGGDGAPARVVLID